MRALDLFCGAGGATVGLMLAGYEVTGVDLADQPWYPGDRFVRGDALAPHAIGIDLGDYDLIWASPPCQAHSVARMPSARTVAPDLIPATRAMLSGYPHTIIENVPGAPLRPDILLTWAMFRGDAPIPRRRVFELSWPAPLAPAPHPRGKGGIIAAAGSGSPRGVRERRIALGMSQSTSVLELRAAFGAHWIPSDAPVGAARRAINAMIPPCYATYLGRHLKEAK